MRIALVAGEASGDLLGRGLIDAIRQRYSRATFEGVAGPEMASAGCRALESAEALAVMGFVEPLRHLPRLVRLRRRLAATWTRDPPDVFVGIDAPDFNLGLEKRLKSANVPVVHYVSPSVWAWRQGRTKKIAAAVDHVLCLLPFEASFLEAHGIAASFVGHPMAEKIPANPDRTAARSALTLADGPVVAVLPGSRHSESGRLGSVFAEACKILRATHPALQFVAPMATRSIRREFLNTLSMVGVSDAFTLTEGHAEQAMTAADVVLLASGTATLQAALLGRPMVVAYRVSPITNVLLNTFDLIKVPHVSLPNLLTEEPLVPEFLQQAATPAALAKAVSKFLDDPLERERVGNAFAALRDELAQGADARAADIVLRLAGVTA